MTARLPLGLIASPPRQVSEHTFLMGHTHNQIHNSIFLKGKTTRENDATVKSKVREKAGKTLKRERERSREK